MKSFAVLFLLFSMNALAAPNCSWDFQDTNHTEPITAFENKLSLCKNETNASVVVLRNFVQKNSHYSLAVNPNTMETYVTQRQCLQKCEVITDIHQLSGTTYGEALKIATSAPYPLENDGTTQANYSTQNVFLTMDLCPSKNNIELDFLKKWIESENSTRKVGLAITGLWMKQHPEEFRWLVQEKRNSHLNITWVNHSLTHPYVRGVPNDKNFLLTSGVDMKKEVFKTEIALLENGEVPSLFFRFPGLISNEEKIQFLKINGLIPLGAQAWVGKGQKIKNGSVILTHGNGNEHKGIEIMEQWFQADPSRLQRLESLENLFKL